MAPFAAFQLPKGGFPDGPPLYSPSLNIYRKSIATTPAPAIAAMNALVYSGTDAAPTALAHTFASLRTLLTPYYAAQPIDQKTLETQLWQASCSLLVFPPFQHSAAPGFFATAARQNIRKYIAGGGKLLVLGTGVRVVAQRGRGVGESARTAESVPPDEFTLEDIDGDLDGLAFSLVPSSQSEEEGGTDATPVPIQLADGGWLKGVLRAGVVDISLTQTSSQRVEPFAYYASAGTLNVAAARALVGLGAVVFWSAHVEAPVANEPAQEKMRLQTLRTALESLGLHLPPTSGEGLRVMLRPTPQVLTGAPWRAGVVGTITRALRVPALAPAASYKFKGGYDTFLFHPQEAAASIFAEQQEAIKTLSDDPETCNPKHIVVLRDGGEFPKDLTSKFNVGTYYDELRTAREECGCQETYRDGGWGIGEALLYGEIVTSTQTMLDKNMRLLTALPAPLLSLASTQLTGCGRGANVWLSPPGCLMFSLLLRVQLAVLPAQKLVFIQYLFALAVVEACWSDEVLGDEAGSRVRIKWPNDIYATTRDGERKKVGGTLVSTSFGAGNVEVVIGCGLNVLNDPPISSLAQLLPDAHTPLTMERTLAEIMARFEPMWANFVHSCGSFEPFMDLYLERWLHSEQEVTLTTVTPPRKVRIVGITADHGLLRTLPEPGRDGSMEYIDLQPDGNSFHLLAGLIDTKDYYESDTVLLPPCWTTNDSLSIRYSTALHPALPIDVLEEVIDQASDNTMSLRCLSLTCKGFLPRARRHLFTGIEISTVEQLDSSGEFLDSRPWLTPLIRKVTLRIWNRIGNKLPIVTVLDVVPVHLLIQLPNLCSWCMGWYGDRQSLNRLTLSCYRRYSGGIQHLEVSGITLKDSILDFTKLVSAFTAIQELVCSFITVRSMEEHSSSQAGPGTNTLRAAQTLRIKTLHIGSEVDIRVIEFLLIASSSTVNSLTLTVAGYSAPVYEDYIHRLQRLTSRLPQLFSLTLRIDYPGHGNENMTNIPLVIRCATRILQHIDKARLSHVRVEFALHSLANLGRFLYSKDGLRLEEFKALEEALLSSFKTPGLILIRDPSHSHRVGRAQFWRPTIEHAFPRLSEQGLLTIVRSEIINPLGHEGKVTSLITSHDSKRIVTASRDGTIILWDTAHGTIMDEWVAHQGDWVNDLALSPDSQRLISAGNATTEGLVVWDIGDGVHKVAALKGHTDNVTTCAWSPDGALMASASEDGTVRVWDAQTFQQRDTFEDAEAMSRPQSLQFSPDASYLAWRYESPGRCTIWKPFAGEQPKTITKVNSFSFDPERRRIATAHWSWDLDGGERTNHVVRVWDIATGTELAVLTGHSKPVRDVLFAPGGRFLLSAPWHRSIRIWETDCWEAAAPLENEEESVIMTACFSSNGEYVAAGSSNLTVRLWRTGDASCAAVFSGHNGKVLHVAFSPDGEYLASADAGGRVHIRRLSDFIRF